MWLVLGLYQVLDFAPPLANRFPDLLNRFRDASLFQVTMQVAGILMVMKMMGRVVWVMFMGILMLVIMMSQGGSRSNWSGHSRHNGDNEENHNE